MRPQVLPRPRILVARLWTSPTATTFAWATLQSLQAAVVLPLVLRRFDAATVAVWSLFATILALQGITAAGFTPTFARAVAFAASGARSLDDVISGSPASEPRPANWDLLAEIAAGMRAVYLGLGASALLLLGTVGTALMVRPIGQSANPQGAWLAWWIVVLGAAVTTWGTMFSCWLEGHNYVARLRRWDTLFALAGSFTAIGVLLVGGGLVPLVAATQTWNLLRAFRNRALCRTVDEGRFASLPRPSPRAVVAAFWPAAWRSGLGVASIYGINQASGVFYAQIAGPRAVASYLLALRLLDLISNTSRAPFYARIPLLARLRALGDHAQQVQVARRGMLMVYWLFVPALVAGALLGPAVFSLIGSDVPFPARPLWLLLGLALLLERYGAMHIQLYSSTNHIVWHTATAGYAVIYLATMATLQPVAGIYAFPLAMLAGQIGWYSWYCARHSYGLLGVRFWGFERTLFVPALVLTVSATALAWIWR
jgi:hypothetical protein